MVSADAILTVIEELRKLGIPEKAISNYLKQKGWHKLSILARILGFGRKRRRGRRVRRQRGKGGLIAGSAPRFWVDQMGRPIKFKSR